MKVPRGDSTPGNFCISFDFNLQHPQQVYNLWEGKACPLDLAVCDIDLIAQCVAKVGISHITFEKFCAVKAAGAEAGCIQDAVRKHGICKFVACKAEFLQIHMREGIVFHTAVLKAPDRIHEPR